METPNQTPKTQINPIYFDEKCTMSSRTPASFTIKVSLPSIDVRIDAPPYLVRTKREEVMKTVYAILNRVSDLLLHSTRNPNPIEQMEQIENEMKRHGFKIEHVTCYDEKCGTYEVGIKGVDCGDEEIDEMIKSMDISDIIDDDLKKILGLLEKGGTVYVLSLPYCDINYSLSSCTVSAEVLPLHNGDKIRILYDKNITDDGYHGATLIIADKPFVVKYKKRWYVGDRGGRSNDIIPSVKITSPEMLIRELKEIKFFFIRN